MYVCMHNFLVSNYARINKQAAVYVDVTLHVDVLKFNIMHMYLHNCQTWYSPPEEPESRLKPPMEGPFSNQPKQGRRKLYL